MDNGTRRPARRSTTPFLFSTHAFVCVNVCVADGGVYSVFFFSLSLSPLLDFQREFSSRVSDFLFKRATTTSRPLPLFACFPAQKTIFCAPPYRAGAGVLPATTVTTQHRPCKLYTEPPISDLMTRAVAPLLPRPHSSFTSNYRQLVSPLA